MNQIRINTDSLELAKESYQDDPTKHFLIETNFANILILGQKTNIQNPNSHLNLTVYFSGKFNTNDYLHSILFEGNIPKSTDDDFYPIATNQQTVFESDNTGIHFTNHYSFETLHSFRQQQLQTILFGVRDKVEVLLPEIVTGNALMIMALLKRYEISGLYENTNIKEESAALTDKSIIITKNIYPKLISLDQESFDKNYKQNILKKIKKYTKSVNEIDYFEKNKIVSGNGHHICEMPPVLYCRLMRSELFTKVFKFKLKN